MNIPKYVIINLNSETVSNYNIHKELFEKYLGGKALAARILYDLLPKGTEPLSPEAILIINTGPMNGTGAPSSSRFNLTFKNVLTNGIGSSNCGGQFGIMLKKAGLDGIIITGKASRPSTIEIIDGEVRILDASNLWGMDAEKTQEEFYMGYGKLVIGPAGENLVRYACALSGERVAGRCGAGAVMGSKNIKAIVAYGATRQKIYNKKKFDKYVGKWIKFLKNHPMTGKALGLYGTAGLVNSANSSGALPTHNFKKGYFDKADEISGETLAERYLIRNNGCISCPIRCERRVTVNGKEVKGPEYETVGLFGSNIDSTNLELINEINYEADILGLDTITLGGTLAFAMELQERGIKDFGLRFGYTDNIIEIIRKIAHAEGEYSELGQGSKWLSEKYGGKEYAIHSKGLELAAYEPRRSVGMGLGYATSNRGGCHLNGGYLALIESVGVLSIDKQTHKGKPELTIFFQNMMEAISSAGFCLFTAHAVIPALFFHLGPAHWITRIANKAIIGARYILRPIWSLLPGLIPFNSMMIMPHAQAVKLATGLNMTTGKLLQVGERGFNIERMFNIREGLTDKNDALPDRLTKTRQDERQANTVVCLDKMLPAYYKLRGWDNKGIPKKEKLKTLGI
jgi:aldehyde:ferredoxin oxidoreductase